jgi:hypothetical protein
MSPEFPLRIITDDGECEIVTSPEELIRSIESLDSTDPKGRVWVRDAYDRTVLVRMRDGFIEVLRLAE